MLYNSFDSSGFKYYIPFQIENKNSQDLTDFQVKLNIDTKTLIDQGYMKSDCSDMRFVDPDNLYELPYWIESGCNTNSTTVWVKVDSLHSLSNKELWLVFGNPLAVSKSNGSAVFEFFDNFEEGKLVGWSFSGTKGWQVTTSYKYEGNYSAMNQDIGDSQTACMYRSVQINYSSNISFYWKVSSEQNYDYLRFYIDGSQKNAISGYVNWQKKIYTLTPGNHQIKWCYTKDGSVSRGTDSGYVDKIMIYSNIPVDYSIDITKVFHLNFLDTENYSYKLPIIINNPNSVTLKDFQVNFVLNTQKLISLGLMNPDCSDLRVTDENEAKVPYWIEPGTCNTTNTSIWIKAYLLKPGENTYYVYFGNPSAKSESNGSAVFEFFDDFEGTSLDTSKWYVIGSPQIVNGKIKIDGGDGLRSLNKITMDDVIIESKGKVENTNIKGSFCRIATSDTYGFVSDGSANIVDILFWSDHYIYPEWNNGEYKYITYPTEKYIKNIIEHIRSKDKIIYNFNGSIYTHTGGTISNFYVYLYNGVGTSYVDWIFVRKYADQQPTVVVNLSNIETTSPMFYYTKIKIINNQSQDLNDVQIPIYLNETNFDFDNADYTGLTIRVYDKRVSNPYEDIQHDWNYKGIPYWIEYFKPEEKRALIWVKINISANSNKTLYIYYSKNEPIRFKIYNPGTTTLENYQVRLPNGVSLDPKRKYRIYLEGNPTELLPWWSKDKITWIKVSKIKPGDNYLIIVEDDKKGLPSDGSKVFEFFDDFDGYTLDSSKWNSTNDIALSDGILYISTNYNDIISKKQFSPNVIIGFKTKLRDSYYNTVLFAVNSPTGYGPGFLLKNGRFYKIRYKYVDSSSWSYGYNTINTQPGWRLFELYWLPSNSYLMFDNNRKYINNLNDYQNRNGYIGLGSWNSGAEFDYVYVRKYADPEPIVSIATDADDGYKVFEFFDDFDRPYLNWIRGDGSYGPIQYLIRNGILTTWSTSGWQTMYSPKTWTSNDKIVIEIKDRRDYNSDWHKAYLTDRDNNGNSFRFGVNGADTVQLIGSWYNGQGTSSYTNQNFRWYIHQIVKDGNHYVMNWLDANNRSLLNWYSADTSTYRNDLVIRQWQYSSYPPAEWDWVKVYKYLEKPPKVEFERSAVFMITSNETILANTTVRIYYPSGTSNLIFEGKTDKDGLLYVPLQLQKGYYDIEAVLGNITIKRVQYYLDPRSIKNPLIQRVEESISS